MTARVSADGLHLRCSALPTLMLCPGARGDGLRIDPVNDAAGVGSAAHEALRALVERGEPEWDRIPDIAATHGADHDEVRMLVAMARKLWQTPGVGDRHQHPLTEVALSAELAPGVTLSGHADIYSTHPGGVAYIDDLKTGFVDASYREQMLGYCALALLDDPRLDVAYARLLWVRAGDVEAYSLTRADLPAWRDRVVNAVARWDGTYHPGAHCEHCPLAHSCKARGAMARADAAALLGTPEPIDVMALTPADAMRLRDVADRAEKMGAAVKAALRERVLSGGVVAGDGFALVPEPRVSRELDTLKAWDVLTAEGFVDEDWQAVLDVSLRAVEERVKAKAPRGKGAAAIRDINSKLEAAGAIRRTEAISIQKRRTTT